MRAVSLLLILCLGACSGGDPTSPLGMALQQIRNRGDAEEAPTGKRTPPRAAIEARGQALVQINLDGDDVWPILQPVRRTADAVLYTNATRQSLYLRESQIAATRGFGTDLIGTDSPANDPLKRLTPPAEWPTSLTRAYRFAGEGPGGRVETYDCTLTAGGPGQIQIAGTPFAVIGFVESCTGAAGAFQNLYAADARTGRVWQSQQFIGQDLPPMTLEILEPLTE